ncbi:MAG: TIGR03943 family protein, partial [Gracilibacteraceae bacterium]|nr:TIGR03943 family protein [Gracilibacteraceae bacterium]
LIRLIRSDAYLSYVTPRMAPYLYFTAAVMLIWAAGGILRLRRPRHRARGAHCFVLAVPILLLILPHAPLTSADLSWNYAGTGALPSPSSGVAAAGGLQLDAVSGNADYLAVSDGLPAVPPGADEATKCITVAGDQFYPWLNEIAANLDKYEGWQIYITGFVLKDPEVFLENEFMAARLGMTCCAADLVPYGLICHYEGTPALAADTWVTVEGLIHAGEYDGWPEPQVIVTGIAAAEEEPGYIYPFG